MIHYDPAHHSFVGFANETGAITESDEGAPAELPMAPSTFALCGYTNHPEGKRGLNNSYGFSIGQRGGAYRKRGAQTPALTLALRGGGAVGLLGAISRGATQELPSLCFFVGVPPISQGGAMGAGWTDVYRFAKINSMALALKEASGEAAEIEVTLEIEAMCRYRLATALSPNLTSLSAALNSPLYWHDVRSFKVHDTETDLRQALTGLNVKIEHNLERKGERPNWGDNEPLSRTCYHLLEHTVTVSGDIQLHSRLDEARFTGVATAQSWEDITLSISNSGTSDDGTTAIALTLQKCMPTDESTGGVEPKAQIGHTVPFVAADYVLSATGS